MGSWKVYHKDDTALTDENGKEIVVHALEYSDTWMGECFVTVTFTNETPINFAIGDYLIYRGERFEINYDPGKLKVSRRDTYGVAFKYDSVKFNSLSDELARCEFLDVVLYDNKLHYTALPKFTFYVSSLDDLLDRIQANLIEQIGDNEWKLYSRNKERSLQRGCSEAEWETMYGTGTEDNTIESKSVTVDNKTCWEALALVNSEWDVNFIVRNRNVYVGTAGLPTEHIFRYGKGNGMYEVDQNAESDQEVITRMRAYGSDQNLPEHYYADLGLKIKSEVTKVVAKDTKLLYCDFLMDLPYADGYFKTKRRYTRDGGQTFNEFGYVLNVTFDYQTIISGYVKADLQTNKCEFYAHKVNSQEDTSAEPSEENLLTFMSQLEEGKTLYITSGVYKNYMGVNNREYSSDLPNNMACDRLMLPGFPFQSLQDYWDSLTDEEKAYVNPSGKEHKFSTNRHRPYIDSLNIDTIGQRQGSVYFDTDDEANGIIEIYPTMEEMTTSTGQRLDEIYEGSAIEDDGRFEDGQTVPNFSVLLRPELGIDISGLKQDDFSIAFKDGMCGGRSFQVVGSTKNDNGVWKLTLERTKDDAMKIWFPYKDYQIKSGDHFVLTGIELPEEYIKAASLKLLKYAIAYLDANDYTRYVYQPKIDEIYMARQHDEFLADKTGKIKSLYLTLKAGDLLALREEDFGIEGEITIDQLTITEADGKIPTYGVTLREDKEVGTITKMQNQISSLASGSGNGGSNGGDVTVAQIKALIKTYGKDYFLSRIEKDEAAKAIRFISGLQVGEEANSDYGITDKGIARLFYLYINKKYGISADGQATLSSAVVDQIHDSRWDISKRTLVGAEGFEYYMDENGKSHLWVDTLSVRMKAVFAQLEIRKISYSGGTTIFSNAGSTLAKVATLCDKDGNVIAYKCYATADDGTTATMNYWKVGMMAMCKTFNVKAGVYENVSNRYYWRMVVGVGQETLTDGKLYDYVILSNKATFGGSDIVPSYGEKILADENGTPLGWPNTMLAIVSNSTTSVASLMAEESITKDDGGADLSTKLFYGYDPSVDNDAPAVNDVIVQVGDQIRYKQYGNIVMIQTSAEDGSADADTVPSISMYHNMGASWTTADKSGVNPYQWKRKTFIASPETVYINSNNFKWLTDDGDVVKPIIVQYDILPSSTSLSVHTDGTTTPSDLTWKITNRNTGDEVEDTYIGVELNGTTYKGYKSLSSVLAKAGIAKKDVKSICIDYIEADGSISQWTNIAVVNDGQQGGKGDKGDKGDDGVSITISETSITYAKGTSPSSAPGGNWSTQIPSDIGEDEYLWSKTYVKYSDNTSTTTYSVSKFGKDADATVSQYSADGKSWHDTFLSGDYYMRFGTKASDGTVTWGDSMRCVGENGNDGDYTDFMYGISKHITASGCPADITSWEDTPVAVTTAQPYLWCKIVKVTYNDQGEEKQSDAKYVRLTGTDGDSISSADVVYIVSASSTEEPADAAGWVTDYAQLVTESGSYVWSATKVTYTDSKKTADITGKRCIGSCESLANVVEMYALTDTNTAPAASASGGWKENYTATQGKYIWSCNVITYTNGTTEYKNICCNGYMGKDGNDGTSVNIKGSFDTTADLAKVENPTLGDGYIIDGYLWVYTATQTTDDAHVSGFERVGKIQGNGIQSTAVEYQAATQGTDSSKLSNNWSKSIPTVGEGNYLWTRTTHTYTDGTSSVSYSVGAWGTSGATPSVSSQSKLYAVTKTTAEPATTDWKATMPTLVKGGYLWTRTVVVWSDKKETTSDTMAYIATDGSNAVRMDLSNDASTVNCDANGNVVGTIQTSTATLYDGATAVSGLTYTFAGTNCTLKETSNTSGLITISTITSGKDITASVKASSTYNGKTYSTIYTVGKVCAGAGGAAAVTYWLQPSVSSVKIDKNGYISGTTDTEYTITCDKYKQTGSATPAITTEKYLAYSIDGGQQTEYTSAGVKVSKDNQYVDFILQASATDATILDKERVPVIADGTESVWFEFRIDSNTITVSQDSDTISGKVSGILYKHVGSEESLMSGNMVTLTIGGKTTDVTTAKDGSFTFNVSGTWSAYSSATSMVVAYGTAATVILNVTLQGKQGGQGDKGDKGDKGEKGDKGTSITIKETKVQYVAGTSGTAHPDSGWSSNIPDVPEGQFLWTYTYVLYSDGTKTETYSASKMGKDANPMVCMYSATNTPYATSPTAWHSTFQSSDKYMVTSADGMATWSNPIQIVGEQGEKGSDGKKGNYTDYSYGVSAKATTSSATTAPSDVTSWSDAPQQVTTAKPYLWAKVVKVSYDSNNKETKGTPTYLRMTGADGVSIKKADVVYGLSNSATTEPTSWNTTYTTQKDKYVWTATLVTYSDGTSSYSGKHCLGESSALADVVEMYVLTNDATTPTESAAWATTYTATQGKYIWSCNVITYTDGTKVYNDIRCNGYIGKNGNDGTSVNIKGSLTSTSELAKVESKTKGDGYIIDGNLWVYTATAQSDSTHVSGFENVGKIQGNGIKSVTVQYGSSTSGTTQPTSWQTTVPSVAEGNYLWTATTYTFTDSSVSSQTTYSVSRIGKNGTSPTINSQVYKYATSTDTTRPADSAFSTTYPSSLPGGSYLWTMTEATWSDNKVSRTYSCALIAKDGANAVRIDLSNDTSTVNCDINGKVIGTIQGSQAALYDGQSKVDNVTYIFTATNCTLSSGATNTTGQITVSGITAGTNVLEASVKVEVVYNGTTYTTVYTISKVMPGANGTSPTSYWLQPSVSQVKVDKNGTLSDTTLTCAQYMQTGSGAVQTGNKYLFYKKNAGGSMTVYSSGITIAATDTFVEFYLYATNSTSGTLLDKERVLIVKDGTETVTYQMYITSNTLQGDATSGKMSGSVKGVLYKYVGSSRTVGSGASISNSVNTTTATTDTNGAFTMSFSNASNSDVVFSYKSGSVVLASASVSPLVAGKQGASVEGESAVNVVVEGAPLTFDTTDKGVAKDITSKSATIKVYKKGVNITSSCTCAISSQVGCTAKYTKGTDSISVTLQTISTVTASGYTLSVTAGNVVVKLTYDGVEYIANVPFTVNVAYVQGGLMSSNSSLESKYTEVSTDLGNKANKSDLKDYATTAALTKVESSIKQTAREISLSVSEATIGKRNLLTGTALQSASDMATHTSDLADTLVTINGGYNGSNAAMGSANYKGSFRWYGASNGNIKVEKGKTYTASCYVKTDHVVDIHFECFYESSLTDTTRPGGSIYPFAKEVTTLNEWVLVTGTFTVPSDSPYEYLEVYIFCIEKSGSGYHYISRPMLEEGEDYLGWTKSDNDLSVVGGNLLNGTRTFTKTGNMNTIVGSIIAEGYGDSSVAYAEASSQYVDVVQWDSPMAAQEDYMMSVMAKGSGMITMFAWKNSTDCKVWTEDSNGRAVTLGDGDASFTLTDQWRRYWIHWSPRDASVLPQNVLIRAEKGAKVYITEPKLEHGAQVTEYTERSSDLVSADTLKKAGIDITQNNVVLYGDQINIKNGDVTSGMFKDGKFNADYLDLAGAAIYKNMMFAKQFHIPYSDAYLQHYVAMGITSFTESDLVFWGRESDGETPRLCVTAKQSYNGTTAKDGDAGTVTVRDDNDGENHTYTGTWHTATWLYEEFMKSSYVMGGDDHKYKYGGIYSDFGVNFKSGEVQGYRAKFNTVAKQANKITYAWNFKDILESDDIVFIPQTITSSNAIGFPEPTSSLVGKVIEVYLAYSSYTYKFQCNGTSRTIDMTGGMAEVTPYSWGFHIKGVHAFKMVCQERGIFSSTDDSAVDPYWIIYDDH